MRRLNRLTDVTYLNDTYRHLLDSDTMLTTYYRSVRFNDPKTHGYVDEDESVKTHELEWRIMPNDTVMLVVTHNWCNKSDFTDFKLINSDGMIMATVQNTECPICSIFVNDDIITVRKLCHKLDIGSASILADEIICEISYIKDGYDIIDKGTDIVTLIPQKKSATGE